MKLLLSVSLLHLNLAIQRRSALTSRTTHHPLSIILTLISLHACRVFTNIVKREGGPPAFEGRYKYISFTRFIDDGKRELERPTTKSGAFGPPPYSAKPNRDDRLRNSLTYQIQSAQSAPKLATCHFQLATYKKSRLLAAQKIIFKCVCSEALFRINLFCSEK